MRSSVLTMLAVLAAATSRPPGGLGTADVPGTCALLPPSPEVGPQPIMRTLPMARLNAFGAMATDPGANVTIEGALLDEGERGTVVPRTPG